MGRSMERQRSSESVACSGFVHRRTERRMEVLSWTSQSNADSLEILEHWPERYANYFFLLQVFT